MSDSLNFIDRIEVYATAGQGVTMPAEDVQAIVKLHRANMDRADRIISALASMQVIKDRIEREERRIGWHFIGWSAVMSVIGILL